MSDHAPLEDIVLEARRLLEAAAAADVPVRLVGGLAVRMHITGEPVIARTYKDIDLVTLKGRGKRVSEFMTGMGYQGDRPFNATNGHRRLLYYDPPHGRQVDVFVGSFEMCHSIPITDRIEVHPSAVPLAELLLTKMQIVELNAKDQADILTILYHHDVADTDGAGDVVNGARIAQLCAGDWGLWRTTRLNVERTRDALRRIEPYRRAAGRGQRAPRAALEPGRVRVEVDEVEDAKPRRRQGALVRGARGGRRLAADRPTGQRTDTANASMSTFGTRVPTTTLIVCCPIPGHDRRNAVWRRRMPVWLTDRSTVAASAPSTNTRAIPPPAPMGAIHHTRRPVNERLTESPACVDVDTCPSHAPLEVCLVQCPA